MRVLVAGLIGLGVFLGLDVIRAAGFLATAGAARLRLDWPAVAPMVVFRLLHVIGLIYFAVVPAFRLGSLITAGWRGGVCGAVAFGIYAVADRTLLRGWAGGVGFGDIPWATAASAITSVAACGLTRWLTA